MERMEKMLSVWLEDQNQRQVPVGMRVVQAKARCIYEDLSKGNDNVKPFSASTGWFSRFTKRYNFHNIKMTGEAASPDTVAAEKFVQELQHIIEEGGYSSKQIFNIDETTVFWKKMPSRTYISQEEKSAPGFKASKDRFMLLLGGNAEGDYKLKPMMVYHSANPRALKGCVKHNLPVHFYSNAKGWVTGPLFSDYLTSKLEGELQEYCAKENLAFKILLIVDDAPGHPTTVQGLCEHIKVVFIPPNTSSLIQPMDQGVIATFKAYYLKKTFDMLGKAVDDKNMSVKEFWKNFSIRDAVMLVDEAWASVPHVCMNAVWRSVCPDLVHDFKGFSVDEDVNKTKEEVVQLASKVGFNDVDLCDVGDLLSHNDELSNEDLIELENESREEAGVEGMAEGDVRTLTSKRLSEALRLFDEGLLILEENDPNTERSSKVKRDILASLTCYSEMLKERMKASQTSLDSFFYVSVGPETQPSISSDRSAEQLLCKKEEPFDLPCITSPSPTFSPSDLDDPLY
ncbi:hypothetical protein Cfor_00232 [Coptotermes formosanus]|uniref:HTH CENPB-type domain-containing protein n=1 Tax=Coptotermes formosanus TaxID=36987 RepID=A0A6L2PBJ2_COPFO|nr:hypothetical protein Cfor_00232 [Coptotermes formosanus]